MRADNTARSRTARPESWCVARGVASPPGGGVRSVAQPVLRLAPALQSVPSGAEIESDAYNPAYFPAFESEESVPGTGDVDRGTLPPLTKPPTHAVENWRYDHAWRILNLNQEVIRATDQKTYMLIVMSTLLISFTAGNVDRLSHEGWVRDSTLPILGLSSIAFFIFALATLLARHEKPGKPETRESLVFFAHVLDRGSVASYCADFRNTLEDDAVDDILNQVVIVSGILRKKLTNFHRSWWCLAAQVAIFLALNISGRLV